MRRLVEDVRTLRFTDGFNDIIFKIEKLTKMVERKRLASLPKPPPESLIELMHQRSDNLPEAA